MLTRPSSTGAWRLRLPVAAAGLVLIAGPLTACRSDDGGSSQASSGSASGAASAGDGSDSGSVSSSSPSPAAPAPRLSITPADSASHVKPDAQIRVRSDHGSLEDVVVTSADGETVPGRMGSKGGWRSTSRLEPDTTYTVSASATGKGGATSQRAQFRTLKPKITATYGINYSGQTVGVGMPVAIQFDSAVTDAKYRRAVEKAVSVSTSPKTRGSWGWLDDRQLMWRPESYWKPGTTVRVNAPLTGVQTGPHKWVANDDSGGFTIGSRMVSHVDMKTHEMTVRKNGTVVRRIPVSTGKPGPKTETRSGTKVIIRKEGKVVMDSTTVGIPKSSKNYYKIKTHWNLRVTWTGEYLHSAPWSVGSQGSTNVSHGCTNMSPENAKWMFTHSKVGDVVDFTGSTRQFQPTEGIGVWVYSWRQWQRRSALA